PHQTRAIRGLRSPFGTTRTYRNVCYFAAFGGKADISQPGQSRFISTRPSPMPRRTLRGVQVSALSFRRAGRRQGDRLDLGEVELAGGVVDIEADDIALCVEIDDEPFNDFPCLDARAALQLDVETVRLRIIT